MQTGRYTGRQAGRGKHTATLTYIHTDRQAYIHTYIQAGIPTYIHKYRQSGMQANIQAMGTYRCGQADRTGRYTYTYIHTYIHTYSESYIRTYRQKGIHTYRDTKADAQPAAYTSIQTERLTHIHA